MSFGDFIQYLRHEPFDRRRTFKTLLGIGAVLCLFAILSISAPPPRGAADFPGSSPEARALSLLATLSLGIFWIVAAAGIRQRARWSIPLAQVLTCATFLATLAAFLLMATGFQSLSHGPGDLFTSIIFVIIVIYAGGAGLLAWHSIRYLRRACDDSTTTLPQQYAPLIEASSLPSSDDSEYVSSPLPFGVFPTFVIMLASVMVPAMLFSKAGLDREFGVVFPFLFLFLFVAPYLYNRRSSRFQSSRHALKSVVGGGSTAWLNASVPFYRLLIYEDAVEIRVMFHCYLIPYARMKEPPEAKGGFTSALIIRSDLPNVPRTITFYGLNAEGAVLLREKYVAAITSSSGLGSSGGDAARDIASYRTSTLKLNAETNRFALAAALIVLCVECAVIFATGQYRHFSAQSRARTEPSNLHYYETGHYTPASTEGPSSYAAVLVETDSAGKLASETFISVLGDESRIQYHDGNPHLGGGTYYSSVVAGAFPMIGMLLMILSQVMGSSAFEFNRNPKPGLSLAHKMGILGLIMFLTAFIVMPAKAFLFDRVAHS